MKPDGGFHSHGGIPKNVFGLFHGKSESKMDDDWAYPHDLAPVNSMGEVLKVEKSEELTVNGRTSSLGHRIG